MLCKQCDTSKPVSEFYADVRLTSGYKRKCKTCLNAYTKDWHKRNPEKAQAANRRWRQRHPDKVQAANRKKRHRPYNPERTKAWRQRRLADPEYRAQQNAQANERATAIRRWLDEYKLGVGCIDCGFKGHPCALHFDHVQGDKLLNVCNSKSIAQAQREIAKCVVRCANCHAIKTWKNHLSSSSATGS